MIPTIDFNLGQWPLFLASVLSNFGMILVWKKFDEKNWLDDYQYPRTEWACASRWWNCTGAEIKKGIFTVEAGQRNQTLPRVIGLLKREQFHHWDQWNVKFFCASVPSSRTPDPRSNFSLPALPILSKICVPKHFFHKKRYALIYVQSFCKRNILHRYHPSVCINIYALSFSPRQEMENQCERALYIHHRESVDNQPVLLCYNVVICRVSVISKNGSWKLGRIQDHETLQQKRLMGKELWIPLDRGSQFMIGVWEKQTVLRITHNFFPVDKSKGSAS